MQQATELRSSPSELLNGSDSALESGSMGVVDIDARSARVTRVNACLCEFLGYSSEQLIGARVGGLLYRDDRPRCKELYGRLLEGRACDHTLEVRVVRKDHSWVWASISMRLISATEVRPATVTATVIDITDRKRAEDTIKRGNDRLLQLSRSLKRQIRDRHRLMNVLHDITMAANRAQCLRTALESALGLICEYHGWLLGHAWLYDRVSEELYSSGAWYADAAQMINPELAFPEYCHDVERSRIAVGGWGVGRVVRSRVAGWLAVTDMQLTQSYTPAKLGAVAGVAYPVVIGETVLAVLEFYARRPMGREAGFFEIMPSVSVQLGHVFERERLEREIAVISDREQRRLGHELHDGLSQQIAAIAMLAGSLANKLKSSDLPYAEQAEVLRNAAELAKRQSRALTRGLIPVEVGPEGLTEALRGLVDSTHSIFGIQTAFHAQENAPSLDAFKSTHLFRIASEAVHNAAKHAEASCIDVYLLARGVLVKDDGKGLAGDKVNRQGDGFKIMRHRASLIGATLSTASSPTGGTIVSCTIHQ